MDFVSFVVTIYFLACAGFIMYWLIGKIVDKIW